MVTIRGVALILAIAAGCGRFAHAAPPATHLRAYLAGVDTSVLNPIPVPDMQYCPRADKRAWWSSKSFWDGYFQACVKDGLTNLRGFSILARWLKERGVVAYGAGGGFAQAVADGIDLGLAIPAKHVAVGVWTPHEDPNQPHLLVHTVVIYEKSYIHRFQDEVQKANMKIGIGADAPYRVGESVRVGRKVELDFVDYPDRAGAINLKGIGGQKRGVVGVIQKILFFLPDAVHASTISDAGTLTTEALITTRVRGFEQKPIYRITFIPGSVAERRASAP